MRLFVALPIMAVAAFGTARAQETCPPPPPARADITSNTFYSDRSNSIVDPVKWEQRKAAMQPFEDFRSNVTRFASRSISGNANWAQCAGRWLVTWADGGAMLGTLNSTQSWWERVWMISGLSMAYISAKRLIPASDRAKIEPWLVRLADAASGRLDAEMRHGNNHLYWLGFALAASATATGNEHHWAIAGRIYRTGIGHIGADGSLPKEMARASLALHYHAFSMQPLGLMAELAAARGEDWYAERGGAIHRLASLVAEGYRSPAALEKRAGAEQKPLPRNNLGWLPFYEKRFPGRIAGGTLILAEGDIWQTMTGGNMSARAAGGLLSR